MAAPIQIKADCTQMGLSVEASNDGGKTWQLVQLTPYKVRPSVSVRQYSTCIDPARDRAEYFASIRARGIEEGLWEPGNRRTQYNSVTDLVTIGMSLHIREVGEALLAALVAEAETRD